MGKLIYPIEIVYAFLLKHKSGADFKDIWNGISDQIHGQPSDRDKIIGDLYTDLVLDNRFVLTKEGAWTLKQTLKYKDLQKQNTYLDQFVTTEGFKYVTLEGDETAQKTVQTESIQGWDEVNHDSIESESFKEEVPNIS